MIWSDHPPTMPGLYFTAEYRGNKAGILRIQLLVRNSQHLLEVSGRSDSLELDLMKMKHSKHMFLWGPEVELPPLAELYT